VISAGYYYQEFKLIQLLTGYKMLFSWTLGFQDSSGYIWCYCFGGVKRIAKFTEFIVPIMAGYILIVLVIIAIDFDQLPVL
jgi:hypothetical protein